VRLNEYTVPNSELRVNASLRIENETLAGQTSSTSSTNKGVKPKVLQVSLLIRFDDAKQLTELTSVAEAMDDKGALTVYDIVEPTANAMNVRQVQFTDNFSVREVDGNKAWRVTFSLKEYLSVSEKAEQRLAVSEPGAQSAEGDTISTASTSQDTATEPLTGFEQFLSRVDKALA